MDSLWGLKRFDAFPKTLEDFSVKVVRMFAQERKYKQDYIECCAKTSQELSDLHQELSYSLAAVVREPRAAVLEAETRKLDRSLNVNLALISLDHQSPERQPLHSTARSPRSNDLRNRTSVQQKASAGAKSGTCCTR